MLDEWYRVQLRERIGAWLPAWEKRVGARATSWAIKRMKTLWGSCNAAAGRIGLNLELAKKPTTCADCILVHETRAPHDAPAVSRVRC